LSKGKKKKKGRPKGGGKGGNAQGGQFYFHPNGGTESN